MSYFCPKELNLLWIICTIYLFSIQGECVQNHRSFTKLNITYGGWVMGYNRPPSIPAQSAMMCALKCLMSLACDAILYRYKVHQCVVMTKDSSAYFLMDHHVDIYAT